MDIFKKKLFSFLLAIIIILASTIFSVNYKMGKEINAVVDGFYTGKLINGETETSIYSQLLEVSRLAEQLADIADRNGLDSEDIRDETEYFSHDIITMQNDISYIHSCYKDLMDEILSMGYEISGVNLSREDNEKTRLILQSVLDANDIINRSSYNSSVREYLNSLQFPAEILADFSGLELPEYFA